jgi:hypothetical protein
LAVGRIEVGTILEAVSTEWATPLQGSKEKEMKDLDERDLLEACGGAPGMGLGGNPCTCDPPPGATTNPDSPFSNDGGEKAEPA